MCININVPSRSVCLTDDRKWIALPFHENGLCQGLPVMIYRGLRARIPAPTKHHVRVWFSGSPKTPMYTQEADVVWCYRATGIRDARIKKIAYDVRPKDTVPLPLLQ